MREKGREEEVETIPPVVGVQCVHLAKLKRISRSNEFGSQVVRAARRSLVAASFTLARSRSARGLVGAHLAGGRGVWHHPAIPSSASLNLGSAGGAPQ